MRVGLVRDLLGERPRESWDEMVDDLPGIGLLRTFSGEYATLVAEIGDGSWSVLEWSGRSTVVESAEALTRVLDAVPPVNPDA
jgi:hypothetical protein